MFVSSYSFIDASTGDYQEEEVFYQEEEEEHFDHLTNQGKLLPMQDRFVQGSTRARHHYILLYEPIPSFLLYKLNCSFIYQSYFLIYDSLG